MVDLFMKVRLECPVRISSILRKAILPKIIIILVSNFLPLKTYSAEVTLAWDPNIESDVGGYVLYYGIDSGVYTEAIDVGKVTEYTLTSLKVDIVYYFAVTAYDIYGNESNFSDELSHVISGNPPIPGNSQGDTNVDDLLGTGSSEDSLVSNQGDANIDNLLETGSNGDSMVNNKDDTDKVSLFGSGETANGGCFIYSAIYSTNIKND